MENNHFLHKKASSMENNHFLDQNALFHGKHSFSRQKWPSSMQPRLFLEFYNLFSKTKREPIRKCNISREIREILRQNALFPEKEAPLCSSHWLVDFFPSLGGPWKMLHFPRKKSTLFFGRKKTLIQPR